MSSVRTLIVLALAGSPARADSPLRTEVAEIAKQVAAHVRENGERAVAVGAFTGPEDGNGGPGLSRAFADAFAKLDLPVRENSRFTLGGTFTPVKEPKGTAFVKLLIELKDARNAAGRKFQGRALRDAGDVAVLVGATVDLSKPNADALALLTTAIETPSAHVGDRVAASAASPFAVEVCVKDAKTGAYTARHPATTKDGQAFVDVKKDEVYALRLVNTSGAEAAAYVTIDGIDLFAFAGTAGEKAAAVITPSGKEGALVRGWPIDEKSSAEFRVAEYGKTAAAQLKASAAAVGVVTVRFAPCWAADAQPPADARGAGPLGTALGERIDTPFRPVKRAIGGVRAVVSVRYTR